MASLIKNQILKHLSKFTKNLSADKINLSTLKGEGEVANLELNEDVLMELMDLPTWLRLTKASCNKVAIKIQLTKLKSQPVCLYLDEVIVEMETCDEPRQPTSTSGIASYSSGGKYGFLDKIMDAMFVSVNSICINFRSHAFHASIQMSRVKVESMNPVWQQVNDIRMTRIKELDLGLILVFKEVEWQTLRIEASAISADEQLITTPLRLITNLSKIRITVKKSLADCSIVASKVHLILDDILWVLTDSQMKAAINYAKSLKEIIAKSAEQSKAQAIHKIQKQQLIPGSSVSSQQQRQNVRKTDSQKFYDRFDIKETSYHVYLGRIDLHLCNEFSTKSAHTNSAIDGGAMQVTLLKISLDHYPFHPSGDRKHFIRFNENMEARNTWAQKLLDDFKGKVMKARNAQKSPSNSPPNAGSSPSHTASPSQNRKTTPNKQSQNAKPQQTSPQHKQTKLLESVFVFRMEDFTVYRVSTPDAKRNAPKKFLTSDKKQLFLPPDMSSVHVEYTSYYFPEGVDFPVPNTNIYVLVNPLRLNLDYLTVQWINAFTLSLAHTADLDLEDGSPKEHVDIRIEALMPRILFSAEEPVLGQPDRPDGLQIQASKINVTNCRSMETESRTKLADILEYFRDVKLFHSSSFPNMDGDFITVPERFGDHVFKPDQEYLALLPNSTEMANSTESSPQKDSSISYHNLHTNSFKCNGRKDVWCVIIDQLWLDFLGVASVGRSRPVPFVESFPVTAWICMPTATNLPQKELSIDATETGANYIVNTPNVVNSDGESVKIKSNEKADIHMLIKIGAKMCAQINHYQYIFLMRLIESITNTQKQMETDTLSIMNKTLESKSMCIAVRLIELEFAMVCPTIPELPSATSIASELGLSPDENSLVKQNETEKESLEDNSSSLSTQDSPENQSALDITLQSSDQVNSCDPTLLTVQDGDEMLLRVASDGCVSMVKDSSGSHTLPSNTSEPTLTKLDNPVPDTKKGTLQDVKKSMTSGLFDRFGQRIRNIGKKDWEDSDDFDNMSIKSDEDDDFVMLGLDEQSDDAMYFGKSHGSPSPSDADSCSIMLDGESDSTATESSSAEKPRELVDYYFHGCKMVSIVIFKILNPSVIIQTSRQDMAFKLEADHLIPSPQGNINLDEFQMKFPHAKRHVTEMPHKVDDTPFKVRLEMGPAAERLAASAGERGFLHVVAKDYNLEFLMTSLTSMTDLIEDEVIPPFMPMLIDVKNISLTMKDDRPPTNLTSPGPVPIDLLVQKAVITRTEDGVFHIAGGISSDTADGKLQSFMQSNHIGPSLREIEHLKTENEKLKQRLKVDENAKEETRKLQNELEMLKGENASFRTQLKKIGSSISDPTDNLQREDGLSKEEQVEFNSAIAENKQLMERVTAQEDELSLLKQERESLMQTLQLLQEELLKSEHNRTNGNSK